jgi:hypothetical protein
MVEYKKWLGNILSDIFILLIFIILYIYWEEICNLVAGGY